MAWIGGQYAVTESAVRLTDALGLSANQYIKQIDVKYSAGAADSTFVYLGPSTVTNTPEDAWVELVPGEAWYKTEGGTQAPLETNSIYIVGSDDTAGNNVFIGIVY